MIFEESPFSFDLLLLRKELVISLSFQKTFVGLSGLIQLFL